MRVPSRLVALKRSLLVLLPIVLISSTGCLVQPQGLAATPSPGSEGASRLPQLLQQLQAGGSGLELFDSTPTGAPTATVTGTPGIVAQALGFGSASTPTPAGTFNGGSGTPTPTPRLITPTPTPKPATPTPTRTPPATVGP